MLDAIGGTPLIRLKRLGDASAAEMWVKLEVNNPTGSYKDRMALAMIEGAERSVNLEGYIFRDDEVGRQFATSLVAAAKRGVAVRLLVDWIGRMGTPKRFFNAMARVILDEGLANELSKAGVEIKAAPQVSFLFALVALAFGRRNGVSGAAVAVATPSGTAVSDEATTTAVEGAGPVPASSEEPAAAAVEGPGPVPAEPGAVEASETTVAEGTGPAPADPESGASEESGSVDGPGPVPAEPATGEATGRRDGSDPDATDGSVPREPGTADPDAATRVDQQGPGAEGLEPEEFGWASQRPEAPAKGDRDLSRTAPVEPGLPGSTAADPYGPAPTTMDKGAHPIEQLEEEPIRSPDEAPWPGPAGAFEEQVPLDRPAGSSDRWREAKQAAERERIARAASTPPEERSPLERARRRLERLVGVGQEHPDEDISPTGRDAAERARRARLGLEEDDDPRR